MSEQPTVGSVLNEKLATELVAENERLRAELAKAARITLAVAAPDIERLAEESHNAWVGVSPSEHWSVLPWSELSEEGKETNRKMVRHVMTALQTILAEKL